MSTPTYVIDRRCDIPMRRSKEKCYTRYNKPWRCTKDCKNCICCLEKHKDGSESHFNPMFKGVRYEFQTEG